MKIIITEEQYSRYMRRRYECMKEFVDKLTSGEEKLDIPLVTLNGILTNIF